MATASPEPVASAAPVTVVTQTRVAAGHDAEFSRWQEEVNGVLAGIPGYLDHSVIPPNPPAQVDWVVVQRFRSAEDARGWLQSEQRLHLLSKIQHLLVGQDDVHLFADGSDHQMAAPVTTIISHRVLPGKEAAFVEWQRRIAAVEATFEGFSGYRFEPPARGVQDDWVTMLRFDSDAHLDAWLNSEQRQQLLKETPDFAPEFHVRKVKTGFDSWLAAGTRPGAEPPAAWKQSMIVLLVLYPTVFLFGFFVGTPFLQNQGVPFWLTLFLSNAASTVLLGYWFTPTVSRALMWWLSPKPTAPPWINLAGAGLVALLYCLCLAIFSQFP